MERPELRAALAGAAMIASQLGDAPAFLSAARPAHVGAMGTTAATPATAVPASGGTATATRWGMGLATAGLCVARAGRRARRVPRRAGPEMVEFLQHAQAQMGQMGEANFLQQVQEFCQQANLATGDHSVPAEVAATLQQWADGLSENAGRLAHEIVPPAYAADLPPVELDPNTTYLYGPDGAVLVDPMNNKPITDDWWNGFIGFQASLIKGIDAILRENGVEQAFGWTIVLYTAFIKLLFFPLQQGQLKSTSMMQLLQPKVKEIQERYKDDADTQQRLLGQLYSVMDVNPLGGCLPVLLQLPIFWSLYGCWRRLAAEKFPHYTEGWLWVPSLAQPNPDFQFKFDWLLQWKDGQPEMGWSDYLAYLVFPAILVGSTIIQQQQASSSRPKSGNEDDPQNVMLQVLPWISVYFIGSLSLELPQAVSVYYSMNTAFSVAQTQVVKWGLRKEIAGYEEFERTGKFPDGAFEDMVRQAQAPPTTLHEAALRGDVQYIEEMLAEPEADINKWDEKQIAPIGYAVACGNLDAVKLLLERGADVTVKDGQDNTFLHYAAGYGQMEILKVLLDAVEKEWPDNTWNNFRNRKGQDVVDAARVNRKGQVVDFLCERLGIEVETVKLPAPAAPAGSADSSEAARARAALLAAAGAEQAPDASSAAPQAGNASAMRAALDKLKSNPEAVEQAKKMMGNMPPQMLQMLTGGKVSEEQAKKAMDAIADMSSEELLERADMVSNKMAKETVPPAEAPPNAKPARSVD